MAPAHPRRSPPALVTEHPQARNLPGQRPAPVFRSRGRRPSGPRLPDSQGLGLGPPERGGGCNQKDVRNSVRGPVGCPPWKPARSAHPLLSGSGPRPGSEATPSFQRCPVFEYGHWRTMIPGECLVPLIDMAWAGSNPPLCRIQSRKALEKRTREGKSISGAEDASGKYLDEHIAQFI